MGGSDTDEGAKTEAKTRSGARNLPFYPTYSFCNILLKFFKTCALSLML